MKVYQISVRADQPSYTVRVGGRNFSKAEPTLVHEVELTDELRASPLLVVEERAPVVEPELPGAETDREPSAAAAPAPDAPEVSADTAAPKPDKKRGKK